jgi:AcrR family transcriptional regulator
LVIAPGQFDHWLSHRSALSARRRAANAVYWCAAADAVAFSSKMNRDAKSQKVQDRIIETTRKLFLERGYEKTTVREISKRSGVSLGSMYHFFETKDDIFLNLAGEVLMMSAQLGDRAAGSTGDAYLRLAIELAVVVHLFSSDTHTAALFATAYRSAMMQTLIIKQASQRNRALFQTLLPAWDEKRYFTTTLTILGVLSAQVNERLHTDCLTQEERVQALLRAVLPVFGADPEKVEATIRETATSMRSKSMIASLAAAGH